jgi:glucose-1-phosphate adenylyltransferase
MAVDSLISGGCIVSGGLVRKSMLFYNVRVKEGAQVLDSVLLPDVVVEEGCRIRKAVIDQGCVVPAGMVIGEDPGEDARRFVVTERGVTLVTKDMLTHAERAALEAV